MIRAYMLSALALATVIAGAVVVRSQAQYAAAPPQRGPAPTLPKGVQLQRDIPYVADGHERQKLDLYVREGAKNLPLVVWIHGGGWEAGSKEGTPAMGLLWRGYAVASINYRLSTHAPYPAQVEDCKAAIRWLRANAGRYGIDPNRIGVWGSSAGGHLSALVGTTGDVKEFDKGANATVSSQVQAVCDFCGPTDISLWRASRPGDTLSKLFGGPIQDRAALVQKANPIRYVSKVDPPFFIAHGDRDPTVPLQHSQLLEGALQKAGVGVTLRVEPGAGHSLQSRELYEAVHTFFDRHLRAER